MTTRLRERNARGSERGRLTVRRAPLVPHFDEPQRPASLVAALALTALTGLANILAGGVAFTLL